jgi:hypothetical protein
MKIVSNGEMPPPNPIMPPKICILPSTFSRRLANTDFDEVLMNQPPILIDSEVR